MMHPDTYVKNTPKGLGIFTARPFRRGEILWIADDLDAKIPLKEYQSYTDFQRKKINTYCYLDDRNRVVVPWDEGKYVNHSCKPNATSLAEFDNISVALRSIAADEEIVEDYYSYHGHFETFRCCCGSEKCRGYIQRDNTHEPGLRLTLAEIAPMLLSMPQPLLDVQSGENSEFRALLDAYRRTPVPHSAIRHRAAMINPNPTT